MCIDLKNIVIILCIIIMNQSEKPTHLTKLFIAHIAETLGQKEGYFQVTQFHMKKDHYYSVKISDGFFKIKVIFLDKASKQIKKGIIKQFSILKGKIKNNGDKLLTAKDQFEVWECNLAVGFTKDWKYGRSNLNGNGQTNITWPEMDSKRSSQEQGFNSFRSSQQFIQKYEQIYIQQSMIKSAKSVIEEVSENNSLVKSGVPDIVASISAKKGPKRRLMLVNSQSLDQIDKKVQSQKKMKGSSLKKEEEESNDWDQLDEEIKCMSEKRVKSVIKRSKSFNRKKRSSTKKKSQTKNLENSSEEDSLEQVFSLSLKQLQKSYISKGLPSQCQIRVTDLVPSQTYSQNHWIYVKMVAIKDLGDKMLCLLKGRQQTIVNLFLKKIGQSSEMLLENKIYQIKLKNIKIYETPDPMSNTDIQLHSDLQKVCLNFLYDKPQNPSNFSYTPLSKISNLPFNLQIHVFGLIKSKFFIPLKNESKSQQKKWLNKCSIVDITSGASVEIVNFSDKKQEQGEVDQPMMGFNLSISTFQNKKTLLVSKKTLLIFGFQGIAKVGEVTPDVKEAMDWLEKGNSVADLIENIENYQSIKRISSMDKNIIDKAYCIESCYLISFGANCKSECCDKCFKKLVSNWCRQCGQKKEKPQTRLYMIATVGDCTGSLSMCWQDCDCRRLIGEKGEGYEEFKAKWMLENVKVWLRQEGKSEIMIVSRIEKAERMERNKERIQKLKQKLWYI